MKAVVKKKKKTKRASNPIVTRKKSNGRGTCRRRVDEAQIAEGDAQGCRDEVKMSLGIRLPDEEEEHVVDADAELGHARILPGRPQAVKGEAGLADAFQRVAAHVRLVRRRPVGRRCRPDDAAQSDVERPSVPVDGLHRRRENELTVEVPLFQQNGAHFSAAALGQP